MSDFYQDEPMSSLLKIGKRQLTDSSDSDEKPVKHLKKRLASDVHDQIDSAGRNPFDTLLEPKSGILRKRKNSSDSDSEFFNLPKHGDLGIGKQESATPDRFSAKREFQFSELLSPEN